jgi:hypothetical protein
LLSPFYCHLFCLAGEGKWLPDVPPNFLVPAGRLHPNRSIERDFELFDEFALFAMDKWYQLPAHSSVRKIQRVYQRLVRLSGVWLHYEWTWKLARDLCWHLRRVALIRSLFVFRLQFRSGVCLLEVSVSTFRVPFFCFLCLVRCSCLQCFFWWRWGCRFFVRMSDVLSSLATPPILIALSK